jgi:hypothetical protein
MDRLNKSLDRGDWRGRDFWAQVVHAIHDCQRSGESPAGAAARAPNRANGSARNRTAGG